LRARQALSERVEDLGVERRGRPKRDTPEAREPWRLDERAEPVAGDGVGERELAE
jgi:hypothetical protein